MKKKFKKIVKKFLKIISLPEMKVLPGQLSFYMLMSLVPLLALCSIIASSLLKGFNLTSEIRAFFPDSLANILLPLVTNESTNINSIILILCYLLISSNGPSSIIITSNELYNFKNQGYFQRQIKAFIMTIIIVVLLLFMIVIPIFGDIIIKFIFKLIGSPGYLYNYMFLYKFIKILISFFIIFVTVKLLYTLAPNEKIKSSTTTLGSLFTTLGWIIATEIFGFYITNIAKYNVLYGNFANILILLIWINLLAYLFVIGMAINLNRYEAVIEEKEVEVK